MAVYTPNNAFASCYSSDSVVLSGLIDSVETSLLTLNNISKSFNKATAVNEFSHAMDAGTTTVVIGPSGCGKSTLLKIITGLLAADSGEVYLDGAVLAAGNLSQLRQQMGYVIQEGGLFPHLTAFANVVIMARHLGWSDEQTGARVQELRELVQLGADELQRYPSELSGGQRQRVSLMRALMLDPALLIMDEPLGALDPMIRYELQQQLREIFESLHKTVFMVTHDLAEAAFFADRIVLMNRGGIEQEGSYDELVEQPASEFVERFILAQRQAPASGRGRRQ